MKEKIHPKYMQAKIVCACGRTYTTGSTKPELHVEVCAGCHPFYTGTHHIIDVQGRVERFTKRYARAGTADNKTAEAKPAEAAPAR